MQKHSKQAGVLFACYCVGVAFRIVYGYCKGPVGPRRERALLVGDFLEPISAIRDWQLEGLETRLDQARTSLEQLSCQLRRRLSQERASKSLQSSIHCQRLETALELLRESSKQFPFIE